MRIETSKLKFFRQTRILYKQYINASPILPFAGFNVAVAAPGGGGAVCHFRKLRQIFHCIALHPDYILLCERRGRGWVLWYIFVPEHRTVMSPPVS